MTPGRRILLFLLLAALAVGGAWLAARPPATPASPVALALQELPALREKVRANPGSADARLELMGAYQILGDRVGAWQQVALAEAAAGSGEGSAPGPALIRRARARIAESLGRVDDAAAAAERARRLSPADLDAARESFRLHTLRGDFDRALAIARETLAAHPGHPTALALTGEALFNVADYDAAIARLGAARAADPGNTPLAVQLGVALLRADRGKEAATLLDAVARGPDAPPQAWEYLGQSRLSQGETGAALEAFARAEAAGAPGGGAAFGIALVHLAREETGTAEAALRRALEKDPEHEVAATTLAQLLRGRGRHREAAVVRGRAALARGEAAEAAAAFREAVRLAERADPAIRVPLLLDLARALQAAEEGPEALAALRRAAALTPRDVAVARRQVETAHALFAPQEALRAILRFERLAPAEAAQAHWWRFRTYRQLQDETRAAAALEAAARLRPDQPEILTWQARARLESAPDAAQVATAGDLLRRALAGDPDDVEIHSSLAEVTIRQKRWVEAGEHLRRALALDPEWGRGRHWLQLAQADRALGLAKEAAWDTARYREAERRRAALARARAAAAAAPRDARRLVEWSTAAREAGRLREARAVARAAVRAAPTDPEPYRALAAASQQLGRLEERIVAMEAARAAARP